MSEALYKLRLVRKPNWELRTKVLLSQDVLSTIRDQSTQNILRDILFNSKNAIDWDSALETIYKHMPELRNS